MTLSEMEFYGCLVVRTFLFLFLSFFGCYFGVVKCCRRLEIAKMEVLLCYFFKNQLKTLVR